MKEFDRSFKNWDLSGGPHIMITSIRSRGETVDELMDNAEVSFENWHGDDVGYGWTVGDFSTKDFDAVTSMFKEFLAGA